MKTPPLEWGQLLLPLLESGSPIGDTWQPRYNIAPTQSIVAVVMGESPAAKDSSSESEPRLKRLRWGLIPGWASDLSIGSSMINARSETIHEKRSFKGPLVNRRCLVVADGYYEWQAAGPGKKKQPYWIHQSDERVFFMAGIWDVNRRATGDWVTSCAIITTGSSEDVHAVHDRMPVIFDEAQSAAWLDPNHTIDELREFLRPAPLGSLHYRPVSTTVNNARHEGPDCLVAD